MNKKDAKDIIERYKSGSCSEDEKALVKDWILFGRFKDLALSDEEVSKDLREIDARLPLALPSRTIRLRLPHFIGIAAASVALFVGAWVYFFNNTDYISPVSESYAKHDIAPGRNSATLILGDGKAIQLSHAKTGIIIDANGLKYNDKTEISGAGLAKTEVTVNTPRGGQYQVLLPDGTKAWLNAASSIKFPSSFVSLKERRVEIDGEVYFEVTKDKMHPFKVVSKGQEISVLGTHFNVNSYNDEGISKTTLVEGSIKVKKLTGADHTERMLQPGQQSVLTNGRLEVSPADIDADLAWKNGLFRFNDEKLESIMQKLSRWYDVDVVFENEALKNEPFAGVTTRFANVSKLLRMLELTGEVRFKLTDGQIRVMNAR
jgi:hypothetical protein